MTTQQALAGDFFWFITIITILFWAGLWVAHAIRHDRLSTMPNPAPEQPEPHECTVTGCHQPATHQWPTGITHVDYYACEGHTPTVRSWAGPYDQELNGTDLQQWEAEL